jgi:hypothetical protein
VFEGLRVVFLLDGEGVAMATLSVQSPFSVGVYIWLEYQAIGFGRRIVRNRLMCYCNHAAIRLGRH